ncbi:MAG: methyltransferase [Planctomycetota bacterium]
MESPSTPPLPSMPGFDYPIAWEKLLWDNGQKTSWVLRPKDFEPLLDDPDVIRRNAQDDYMPYWAQVWAGSFVLADLLASHSWPKRLAVLEIGCGLGLAGLAALSLGMNVDFTDYEPLAVDFALQSALANGFKPNQFSGYVLDYRKPINRQYPLILGGEVLYEAVLVRSVCGLLQKMLAPAGEAWLADPYRRACDRLDEILAEFQLSCECRESSSLTNRGERVRGYVRVIKHLSNGIHE